MNKIKLYSKLNAFMHKMGLDFRRYPTADMRNLISYLSENNVTVCIDAGANTGQYAQRLRASGYKGQIISFEPQSKPFAILSRKAKPGGQWKAYNLGLGDKDEMTQINISRNSVSSSVFEFAEGNVSVNASPQSAYIGKEQIQLRRLDGLIDELQIEEKLFLKIDAQGYESKILEGAEGCFRNIFALQLELSCIPIYAGEKLFDEMKQYVEAKGFYVASLESGFIDPKSGRLLQVEAIFLKEPGK